MSVLSILNYHSAYATNKYGPDNDLTVARNLVRELIEADIEYDSARALYNSATRTGNYTSPRALRPNDPVLIDYRNAIERRHKALMAIQGLST